MTSEQVKYIMDKMFRFEVSKYGKGSLDPYFLGYCRCLVELRSKIIDEERKEDRQAKTQLSSLYGKCVTDE